MPGARAAAPDTRLLDGPIARTLLMFSLPTLGSNILQSLNGSINAVWVGQFLGEAGLAATSNANLVMFMVFSVVFGFGMAATILIGQSMGRRDLDGTRRATGAGAGLFLLLSLLVAIGGWLGAPALLRLLGTPADIQPMAIDYLRVMFLGMPPGMIGFYLAMALRGTGDAMTPLLLMIPGALVDVALNPVLILGLGPAPQMGIAGAGAATAIANWLSVILLVTVIYRRDLPIRLRGAELRYLIPSRALMRPILARGAPIGMQMIVVSASALVMMGLVNRAGTATVAAYGAINQLWTYIQMPAIAIGTGVSAMAAQNIGAGLWKRVDRIALAGIGMNLVLTSVLVGLVLLVDRHALTLFLGTDGVALDQGRRINLLASWSFILFGVTMVMSAVVRANGATLMPLLILFIALIPGRLGAAQLLLPVLGTDAIWWSFPIGSILSLAMTAAYYRKGGWRRIRLAVPPPHEETREAVQSETEPAARVHPAA